MAVVCGAVIVVAPVAIDAQLIEERLGEDDRLCQVDVGRRCLVGGDNILPPGGGVVAVLGCEQVTSSHPQIVAHVRTTGDEHPGSVVHVPAQDDV